MSTSTTTDQTVKFPSGDIVPALGQGTWHLGEHPSRRHDEIAALRLGIDLGMSLIDTAEMYGDGATEELVGEAIQGRRDRVYLVSKVLPHHATRAGTIRACELSLGRLGTDSLDLYLLHWRIPQVPLDETIAGFEALMNAGKIRHWGVSNFDINDMQELASLGGRSGVQTDQVLYNLSRRGIEYDLLPWCQEAGAPVMAYSPIEQGRILTDDTIRQIAGDHGATPAQIALAWVLGHEQVIPIPKAGTPKHVRENHGALHIRLSRGDLAALDRAFPPPREPQPLEML
jgi:diketogulonate reductase-like aldo/keto reductase